MDDSDFHHFQTDSRATGTFKSTPLPRFRFTSKFFQTRILHFKFVVIIYSSLSLVIIQLYQLFNYYYLVIIQLYQLFKYLFYSLVYHSSIRYSFSCSPTQDSLIDYQVPANQCQKNEKNSVSNTFLDFFSHCLFVFILPVCASWAITIARYFTTGPACSPASRLLENVKTQRKKNSPFPSPKTVHVHHQHCHHFGLPTNFSHSSTQNR